MLKLFVDSDIFLDVFLEREPFYLYSEIILSEIKAKKYNGFTSPIVIANLYYLLRKKLQNKKANEIVLKLLGVVKVLDLGHDLLLKATQENFSDFEDSIQYTVAVKNKMDFIITRNLKDYKKGKLKALTPEMFLKL